MPVQSHPSDDLQAIKGIAATRETWLHEIGIHSIEELAAAQAAALEHKLQAAGHTTPLAVIKDWIVKAKAHLPTAETESPIEPDENDRPASEWQTFAEFFVDYQRQATADGGWTYQTRAHRMRNGGKDKLWEEELAGEPVGRWMREQLGDVDLPAKAAEERPLPNPPPPTRKQATTRAVLTILDIELQQPGENPVQLDETGRMFVDPIQSNTPFDLHVAFALTGQSDSDDLHFCAQTYATRKMTKETFLLSESQPQPIIPNHSRQIIKLPGIQLPAGIYDLQLMVQALEQAGLLGFWEVPLLQVL